MKASVDLGSCTGCTLCADIAPEVFAMGDDGLVLWMGSWRRWRREESPMRKSRCIATR